METSNIFLKVVQEVGLVVFAKKGSMVHIKAFRLDVRVKAFNMFKSLKETEKSGKQLK